MWSDQYDLPLQGAGLRDDAYAFVSRGAWKKGAEMIFALKRGAVAGRCHRSLDRRAAHNGNTGSGKARLLTNILLPKGAPQITVVQESQFGPAVSYEAKFPLPSLATETEIVQQVIDLPPGWRAERPWNAFTDKPRRTFLF